MELSCTTDHRNGVTLVACRLRNPAPIARRVRVANELDGPVLPPRTNGEPLPGWDADGVTVRISPEATAALGYAVPAPPEEPPATVAADEPDREGSPEATAAASDDPEPPGPTAADAVRTLGVYRPPRAAVTDPDIDQVHPEANPEGGTAAGDVEGAVADEQPNRPTSPLTARTDAKADVAECNRSSTSTASTPTASPADPAAVDAWLDVVERRVERAERLDGAGVPTATEVVAAAGGLDAVRELNGKVDADAERLRTVAERAAALADRAAEAEVPTEPLGRLA